MAFSPSSSYVVAFSPSPSHVVALSSSPFPSQFPSLLAVSLFLLSFRVCALWVKNKSNIVENFFLLLRD
ncbi:hypothetical protein BVRB_2g034180 [Beta vulgaris subsp. vulgaris]|nr:hypothetical protein BVRB_2g034180 [Beta vulgaris subsp. vulgaris]